MLPCGITALHNTQVQGYGSRLMNELKMVAIREDLSHFHTYADNYAIGYFAKHGFTKNLTMSRDRWWVKRRGWGSRKDDEVFVACCG